MNKVLAQTQQMGAGTQNMMTGLTDIAKAGLTYGMGDRFSKLASKATPTDTTLPDDGLLSSSVMDDPKLEEAGIEMDFGGDLPAEADAAFLKANPMLMSMYYKDPTTGKFIRR